MKTTAEFIKIVLLLLAAGCFVVCWGGILIRFVRKKGGDKK